MRLVACVLLLSGCFPGVLLPLGPAELPNGVRLGRGLCGSLVPARINDTLGWFELDSGAYMHILDPGFVDRAELPVDITVEDAGPHGRRRVGTTDLVIPRVVRIDRPELSIASDDSNLAGNLCGLDGLLAPAQLVHDGEALVVDYRARTLTTTPEAQIEDALAGRDARFTATRNDNEYTAAVDATIGDTHQRMYIDTGSFATFVTKASAPGRALLGRSRWSPRVNRIDGSVDARVADTVVAFGDVRRSVRVLLTGAYPYDDALDGVIGMDALASCVLAFTRSEIYGACP